MLLENNTTSIEFFEKINKIKILALTSHSKNYKFFLEILFLPTSIKDINQVIENSIIKKKFSVNTSINIKGYVLDKNEKKTFQKQKIYFSN